MEVDMFTVKIMIETIEDFMAELDSHDQFFKGMLVGKISALESLGLIDKDIAQDYKERLF